MRHEPVGQRPNSDVVDVTIVATPIGASTIAAASNVVVTSVVAAAFAFAVASASTVNFFCILL